MRTNNYTGNTDHEIAVATSALIHIAIIFFSCWTASEFDNSLGAMPHDGGEDLVVQFISLDRLSTYTSPTTIEAETADIKGSAPFLETENIQPDRDEAQAPIDSVVPEPTPGDGARSLPPSESSNESQPGGSGTGDDLESRYIATLKAAIYSKWKTSNDKKLGSCDLTIQQAAGGSVLAAKLENCNLSPAEQRAFEAATLMAQPLPYAGFESVFVEDRTINVDL